MFVDCPAYADDDGLARCALPAEVRRRYTAESTGGPLENAVIRCPLGHWFHAPIEFLTLDAPEGARPARGSACGLKDSGRSPMYGACAPPDPQV
jgi:hypothetical protein